VLNLWLKSFLWYLILRWTLATLILAYSCYLEPFFFFDRCICSRASLFSDALRYFGGSIFSPLLKVIREIRPTSIPVMVLVSIGMIGIQFHMRMKHTTGLHPSWWCMSWFYLQSHRCNTILMFPIFERMSLPSLRLSFRPLPGYVNELYLFLPWNLGYPAPLKKFWKLRSTRFRVFCNTWECTSFWNAVFDNGSWLAWS